MLLYVENKGLNPPTSFSKKKKSSHHIIVSIKLSNNTPPPPQNKQTKKAKPRINNGSILLCYVFLFFAYSVSY